MKELNRNEMLDIEGGSNITGSMLTAFYKIIDTVYSIGESLGSYIRRLVDKKMCNI